MKRVKKGFDELLHGQLRAQEHGGRLRISQGVEPDELNSWVSLPVEACEALGMTAVLEDVPTPGETLLAALESEGLYVKSETRSPVGYMACLKRAAEVLGIKPEDES